LGLLGYKKTWFITTFYTRSHKKNCIIWGLVVKILNQNDETRGSVLRGRNLEGRMPMGCSLGLRLPRGYSLADRLHRGCSLRAASLGAASLGAATWKAVQCARASGLPLGGLRLPRGCSLGAACPPRGCSFVSCLPWGCRFGGRLHRGCSIISWAACLGAAGREAAPASGLPLWERHLPRGCSLGGAGSKPNIQALKQW